jgi:hypothetical protein
MKLRAFVKCTFKFTEGSAEKAEYVLVLTRTTTTTKTT